MAVSRIANGLAMPAPLPAKPSPTIAGMKNVPEKTGPMYPTDCATTSGRERFPLPRRPPSC